MYFNSQKTMIKYFDMFKKIICYILLFLFISLQGCFYNKKWRLQKYYKNGQLKYSKSYKSGKKHGNFKSFSKNGDLILDQNFKMENYMENHYGLMFLKNKSNSTL